MSNNLINVQQMQNVYKTEKKMIKLGILNIGSLFVLFVNEMITDQKTRCTLFNKNLAKTRRIHYFKRVCPLRLLLQK